MAPLKSVHIKPTLQGLYHLAAFSTDSLQFRNHDLAMQAIPEEADEEQDCDSESGSGSSSDAGMTVSSNPEVQPSVQMSPQHQRRVHRLLARFRKLFNLSPHSPSSSARTRNEQGIKAQQGKFLPDLFRNLHRRRS